MESDAAMTDDLIAYNIIPLDAPSITNTIVTFPEVIEVQPFIYLFIFIYWYCHASLNWNT